MPLQNRVDPFGAVHATAARGMFTGNRGVIHDPASRTLLGRRWTTRAWIICLCAFGERKRDVMGRNAPSCRAGWTELFFLDEVTALAAGHRPCFFCRREAAVSFSRCFAAGLGLQAVSAPEVDRILHAQRLSSREAGGSRLPVDPAGLPDGAMVGRPGLALARRSGQWLSWSFEGWIAAAEPRDAMALITPPATVAALRAGYGPVWHGSAPP